MKICATRSGSPTWSMPMKPPGAVTAWGIMYGSQEMKGEQAPLPQTEKDAATGPFCDRVMDLGSRLCDAGQKLKSGDIPWKAAAKIEKRFARQLHTLCKQTLRFKPAETLRTYLAGPEHKFLFH